MCNKAVDASLLASNFVPDSFVTNEMIKKHSDNTIFVKYSANKTFLSVDLNNIIIILMEMMLKLLFILYS